MTTKGALNRILGLAVKYIQDYTDKSKRTSKAHEWLSSVDDKMRYNRSASHSGVSSRMTRVTDDLGNEYYCPMNVLKDPNFVRDEEKSNCFDYTILSTNHLG